MVAQYYKSFDNLLGELQLAFILFLFLLSYPALAHWKQLMYIISSSQRILTTNPAFTTSFTRILYEQLSFAPEDFFENELSKDNFLRPICSSLFASLQGPPKSNDNNNNSESNHRHPDIIEHKNRLFQFVRKRFGLFDSNNNAFGMYPQADDGDWTESAGENAAILRRAILGEGVDEFNLVEEDMPVLVLDPNGTRRRGSTLGTAALSDDMMVEERATEGSSAEIVSKEETIGDGAVAAAEGKDKSKMIARYIRYQEEKYSWRYPMLHASRQRWSEAEVAAASASSSPLWEDYEMTAMRLLDETEVTGAVGGPDEDSVTRKKLREEAIMFIEYEVSRGTHSG